MGGSGEQLGGGDREGKGAQAGAGANQPVELEQEAGLRPSTGRLQSGQGQSPRSPPTGEPLVPKGGTPLTNSHIEAGVHVHTVHILITVDHIKTSLFNTLGILGAS